ncbi:putative gustatory receptor 36c [Musca autumnalis]|uniref:putative gustatory receptor 36c n=1 Tax=Musca autumnalis TaxID=221902 RepID=UPI003CF0E1D3
MKHSTLWILKFCYYASQALGVLSFNYDYRTGEIYTSPCLTGYCALINILKIAVIPLVLRLDFNLHTVNVTDLHFRISSILAFLRPLTIFLTLVFNWIKRHSFMQTLRDFEQLRRNFYIKWPLRPGAKQKFESDFKSKFVWSTLTSIFMTMGAYEYFKILFKEDCLWVYLPFGLFVQIFNVSLFHYYFLLLVINTMQLSVKEEVKTILQETCQNFVDPRLKLLIPEKCNDVDQLARVHYALQHLVKRINGIYDMLVACILLSFYLNNVGMIYMAYMSWYHRYIQDAYSDWCKAFMNIGLICYHIDLKNLLNCMFGVQDNFAEIGTLIRAWEYNSQNSDQKLEETVSTINI